MFRMKLAFVFLFTVSYVASAETVYWTFPKKDAAETLSKQDIALRLGEKDVVVSEVFAVDTTNRTLEILSHPAGRRHYFLILDLINLTAPQALQSRKLVEDFLNRIPKDELVALGAITNEDGLRFFSGLTADRSKILSGWNAMGKVVISGNVEGPEGNIYPSDFLAERKIVQLIPDQEFLSNLKTYALNDKAKQELAPLYVQAFVDLASLMSTVPGRKHLIFFSSGTDVSGLQVNLEDFSGAKQEQQKTEQEQAEEDHKTLREITQVGPRDRASMDTSDRSTSGRTNDANVISKLLQGTGTHVHVFRPGDQDNGYLKDLSQKTKGIYQTMQAFPSASQEILNSDKSFYVIAWQTTLQRDFHELQEFELKTRNERVESTPRWLAPKPVIDYTILEKRIRLSQAIYKNFDSAKDYRFWTDIVLDDGFNRISSFTQVPGKPLLNLKAPKLDLMFYGFALEEDGALLDYSSTAISLDLTNANLIGRLQKTGLKVWSVLFAAQRPVTVRTIVWNDSTGEAMTHSAIVDFDATQLLLTTPFFPSSNFDWILWPAPDQVSNRRGKEILYPYQIGADVFAPELFPRLQPQEKGKVVYFKLYNYTPGEKYPEVRLRLISENGNSTEIQKFALLQQPRLIPRGGLEVFWTIDSIPGLNKGSYRFQVNVTDQAQGKSVFRDVLMDLD